MVKLNYNRIKYWQDKRNKTNIEMADHLGVDVQSISNWRVNASQPDLPMLFRLGEFLEVEAGDLLTKREDLEEVQRKQRRS